MTLRMYTALFVCNDSEYLFNNMTLHSTNGRVHFTWIIIAVSAVNVTGCYIVIMFPGRSPLIVLCNSFSNSFVAHNNLFVCTAHIIEVYMVFKNVYTPRGYCNVKSFFTFQVVTWHCLQMRHILSTMTWMLFYRSLWITTILQILIILPFRYGWLHQSSIQIALY